MARVLELAGHAAEALAEPLEATALRPLLAELERLTDERGRELYDLLGAPRPPADAPAPLRLLGEWDNVLPTILLDGIVAGTWWWRRREEVATLEATPFRPLTKTQRGALEREAELALRVLEPAATAFVVEA